MSTSDFVTVVDTDFCFESTVDFVEPSVFFLVTDTTAFPFEEESGTLDFTLVDISQNSAIDLLMMMMMNLLSSSTLPNPLIEDEEEEAEDTPNLPLIHNFSVFQK